MQLTGILRTLVYRISIIDGIGLRVGFSSWAYAPPPVGHRGGGGGKYDRETYNSKVHEGGGGVLHKFLAVLLNGESL